MDLKPFTFGSSSLIFPLDEKNILELSNWNFYNGNAINRALVSVGAVGAQHPQIFSKAEFAPTDFKGNPP